MPLEPHHCAPNRGVSTRDPGCDESRHHGPGSVDVVCTPAPEPRAIVLLGRKKPVHSPLALVWRAPERGQHLNDVRCYVGTRGIDQLSKVAERELPAEGPVVVHVEGAPTPVPTLHAERPGDRAVDGPPVWL